LLASFALVLLSQKSIWNLLSSLITLFFISLSHSLSHSTSPQFRQDTTTHPTKYITTTYTSANIGHSQYNKVQVLALSFPFGMEGLAGLSHLFVTIFLTGFSGVITIPSITDVTMAAICPGQDQCSLAIYLSGIQQAVSALSLITSNSSNTSTNNFTNSNIVLLSSKLYFFIHLQLGFSFHI